MMIEENIIARPRLVHVDEEELQMLQIHSIESFGTHDGPGIRLVIFTQGCQFKCLYCANPDTIELKGGRFVGMNELVSRAKKEQPYFGKFGGVTVSGGEPTLHSRFLRSFFKRLHKEGINTALDSNGRVLNEEVKELLNETDFLLLDIKHFNDEWHHKLTGVSNKNAFKVAAYRESTGKPMWLRYVLVPGWSDQEEYLHALGNHFKEYSTIQKIEIQPYHKLGMHKWEALGMEYKLKGVEPPTKEQIFKTASIFGQYFKQVKVN